MQLGIIFNMLSCTATVRNWKALKTWTEKHIWINVILSLLMIVFSFSNIIPYQMGRCINYWNSFLILIMEYLVVYFSIKCFGSLITATVHFKFFLISDDTQDKKALNWYRFGNGQTNQLNMYRFSSFCTFIILENIVWNGFPAKSVSIIHSSIHGI